MEIKLDENINATIAAAVQSKVDAAMMEALSGDEVIGRFVTAALTQKSEHSSYRYAREKPTVLQHTINEALQELVRESMAKIMEEERPKVEVEVRKALRAGITPLAEAIVDAFTASVESKYRTTITVERPPE